MKLDLHIHSKYSYDSFSKVSSIIKSAKRKGLSGIAIADHNSFKGSEEALKLNKDSTFFIIPAQEVQTEYGDIIGLFIQQEIKSRIFLNTIKEIKEQNGIVVFPHPFGRKRTNLPEKYLNDVDIIEVLNARTKKTYNEKAKQLAREYNKPICAGSDAHCCFSIGDAYVEVEGNSMEEIKRNLLINQNNCFGQESPYYLVRGLSYITEKIKSL